MSTPWLHVVGIGEDGLDGLLPAVRTLVETAEVIFGGDRHHELTHVIQAERASWPSPFSAMPEALKKHKGRRVVVLVTGDPLWYSAGAKLGRVLGSENITYHPSLSAFQLAAARMGWSLADLETLTIHGRAAERIIPYIEPGARLLILAQDRTTPGAVADLMRRSGYGNSPITALAHMGGSEERRFDGTADAWTHEVPDFHTLAVECIASPGTHVLSRAPGLPDDAFAHDGNLTKREVRSATLAKLGPVRGGLLWDVGLGCGSVAIEWMRAARDARAIGIEPREDRRSLAAANAALLGVPDLKIIEGSAPGGLAGLEVPDAVFIGGGLSERVFDICWEALRPFGRLVSNTVTLESEAVLLRLAEAHGGELVRMSVERVAEIGTMHGWKPLMPVVQWSIAK